MASPPAVPFTIQLLIAESGISGAAPSPLLGIELASAYVKYGLTYEDFVSSRFVRLRRIRELLSAGVVDEMLRRNTDRPLLAAATEITPQAH